MRVRQLVSDANQTVAKPRAAQAKLRGAARGSAAAAELANLTNLAGWLPPPPIRYSQPGLADSHHLFVRHDQQHRPEDRRRRHRALWRAAQIAGRNYGAAEQDYGRGEVKIMMENVHLDKPEEASCLFSLACRMAFVQMDKYPESEVTRNEALHESSPNRRPSGHAANHPPQPTAPFPLSPGRNPAALQ
jgi:hypothetical protein